MAEHVIVLGAGGHGRVIADIIRRSGDILMGFLDDRVQVDGALPLLGKFDDAPAYADRARFIIAIGDNQVREKAAARFDGILSFYTAVHPSAVIADDVILGSGTAVMAGAVINTGSALGCHCILNTAATIDHDCRLGDFVHISPGAHLNGCVVVGSGTWIGTGGIIINNINITGGCRIGAGGLVIRDILRRGTYVGVPVRMLEAGA
jgi:sugar O-acyltransferase (sialic acid O-acetyltransferase NeuD family)